jgi:hypothetical protein
VSVANAMREDVDGQRPPLQKRERIANALKKASTARGRRYRRELQRFRF